jgi:hypothetical protein
MHERSTYPIPDSFSISEQGERLEGNFMDLRDVRRLRGEFPPAPVACGPCCEAGADLVILRVPGRRIGFVFEVP